jgi:hypothetical protein
MANCIFRFRAHLRTGYRKTFWAKDWVIAKSLISDWGVENPTSKVSCLNVGAAIWQGQRGNTCEVRAPLFIRNSDE